MYKSILVFLMFFLIALAMTGCQETKTALSLKNDVEASELENLESQYPYHDIGEFDYASVAKVSEKQKIEVVSADDNSVILAITNINEIVDFLNLEQMTEWKTVNKLPSDAQLLRYFVRYTQLRNTTNTELKEHSKLCLYKNNDSYYIEMITGYLNSLSNKQLCLIPNDVGEYLSTLQ